ncbi:hypothetical protein M1K46_05870 [Fictibacillus sp. WQ 8-8]|uniref:hypothetical protein n=1 Tax=Fictibacillus sp. WQ 8-8 TaxID=2938788 RepID=UPI00210D9202|nr:hypothetical protein [Fictibacillus sp. WQ 8-8]MCQ6265189.1 hypothetical protein [Fictibacillus sp. WQ 8-8]
MDREGTTNPGDIALKGGYRIEAAVKGFQHPISLLFTASGRLIVGEAGVATGYGRVIEVTRQGNKVIAEGFEPPLTGINQYGSKIYVSHRGKITAVTIDGEKEDILTGLPSHGDHHNNKVVFGRDDKMYFGQGTATNSGVVGKDSGWLKVFRYFHDYPGQDITLNGQNFKV